MPVILVEYHYAVDAALAKAAAKVVRPASEVVFFIV
jgi:hypothetical protein